MRFFVHKKQGPDFTCIFGYKKLAHFFNTRNSAR